jgi:hypothetical protein
MQRQGKVLVILLNVALILTLFAPALSAEEQANEQSDWEFQVVPYMWFISTSGDVTVKGQKSDLDLSFNDIWDELNIAAMLAFDARKGRWGFYGDIIYANLGDSDVEGPLGFIKIDPTVKLMWLTAGGFYRLGTWDLSEAPAKKAPTVTMDVFAGARYTYLDINLDLKGFQNASGDKHWVDPLVGARAIFDLTERWAVSLDGSIGGFGVGSDFAWDAAGLIGYRFGLFGEDNAALFGGYRARYQDYTDGSGDDKFKWDVTLHGPILGLAITF